MCYSAMVEQNYLKLAKRYNAKVDLDRYEELFRQRCEGVKLTLPRGMEAAFTNRPTGKQEKAIATLIRDWHQDQMEEREQELLKQSQRLADAENKLKKKETKKALNDQRIASEKIPWLKEKIKWHQLTRAKDADYRIYPQHTCRWCTPTITEIAESAHFVIIYARPGLMTNGTTNAVEATTPGGIL